MSFTGQQGRGRLLHHVGVLFTNFTSGISQIAETKPSFWHRAENSADRSRHFFIVPEKFLNGIAQYSLVSTTSMPRSGECVIGMRIAYHLHHEAAIVFVSQYRKDRDDRFSCRTRATFEKDGNRCSIRTQAFRCFSKEGGCDDGCLVLNRTTNTAEGKTKMGEELCGKASPPMRSI